MRDIDAAWAAGYIDGDGCICLYSNERRYRKLTVSVDSTDIELIDEMIRLAGGTVVKKKRAKKHHRQAYTWRLYGSDKIISFLTQVEPFMRCMAKKERALLIIREWRELTPRNGFYTDELRALKDDFEERFLSIGSQRGSQTYRRIRT